MTNAPSTTISAHWIAIPDGPPIEDGWLEIADGKIRSIEKRSGRKPEMDFGDAVVLPGFVNAHTHLDLNGARDLTPPRLPFPDWLRDVIAFRRTRSAEQVSADIADGIGQSLAAGTTLVGDISVGGGSWGAIHSTPLKATVFHELIGLSDERADAAVRAAEHWLSNHPANPHLHPGLSPHAPYSFRFDRLAQLNEFKVPIALHLAESLDEFDLIMDHEGEFVPFLEELGAWDPTGLPNLDSGTHPLHQADRLLLVHGNFLPGDVAIAANATMVYCPRTHAAFDHPPHPFREWLRRGVRVALGTDSLASNPDLSILAEARFVFEEHEDLDPAILLQMITSHGAFGLGFDASCGKIEQGFSADLCIVGIPASARSPLRRVFSSDDPVRAVFIDGHRMR